MMMMMMMNIESIEHLMLQRQLRWLGRVIRIYMPSNRRRLLYGIWRTARQSVGRPKLRYSDNIRSVLSKCGIRDADLKQLEADAVEVYMCYASAEFHNSEHAAASERRAGGHAAVQATRAAGPACPQRGRIGASDFGLRTHLRSHQRPH